MRVVAGENLRTCVCFGAHGDDDGVPGLSLQGILWMRLEWVCLALGMACSVILVMVQGMTSGTVHPGRGWNTVGMDFSGV